MPNLISVSILRGLSGESAMSASGLDSRLCYASGFAVFLTTCCCPGSKVDGEGCGVFVMAADTAGPPKTWVACSSAAAALLEPAGVGEPVGVWDCAF